MLESLRSPAVYLKGVIANQLITFVPAYPGAWVQFLVVQCSRSNTFASTSMYLKVLNESVHKSSDKDDIRIPGTYCSIHWGLRMWGCWLMRKKKNPESPVCIWKLKDPLSIIVDRDRPLNLPMTTKRLTIFLNTRILHDFLKYMSIWKRNGFLSLIKSIQGMIK